MPLQDAGKSAHRRFAPHRAGGIARAAQHDYARARRDRLLPRLGPGLPPVLCAHAQLDGGGARQAHHVRVAHPVRVGDDRLVALVEQRLARVVERLLGAGGGDDLRHRPLLAHLAVHPVRDRLAQLDDPGRRGVLRVAFLQRVLDRPRDVRKDGEVRLPHAEGNDLLALAAQLDGAGGDGEGSGWLRGQHAPGEGRHFCVPWGGPNLRRRASSTLGGTRPATSPPSRATSRTKRLEM